MTPLERAARALFESSESDLNSHEEPNPPWDELTDNERRWYFDRARAVLNAIREPSEGMREAGLRKMHEQLGKVAPEPASDAYRAMIDAALSEGEAP